MTTTIVKESFKIKLRELDFDQLQEVFFTIIQSKTLTKEQKRPLIAYIEGRLKRLLKKKDYDNSNMTDSEYVAKWGK